MNNIEKLRDYMRKEKIDAFIIPSNDPHFSEYVADYWKCREWISGFTGSAATVAVTCKKAALWTDSRYFLQAENQLERSGIDLKKIGLDETETITEWLHNNLNAEAKTGIDEKLFSLTEYEDLQNQLLPLQLVSMSDPFVEIWEDRPKMPQNKAFLLSARFCGKTITEKLKDIETALGNTKDTVYIISALDEIAWLFNLRGSDIDYNPTAIAYAIIDFPCLHLFIDTKKISPADKKNLIANNVQLHEYNDFVNFPKYIDNKKTVIINQKKTSIYVYNILQKNNLKIQIETKPNGIISSLKSIKNNTEISGFRQAMIADGIALTKFFIWIEKNIGKTKITELDVSAKLHELRAKNRLFAGESFETIAAYAEHGAIVHYEPTKESNIEIKNQGFLLIDSGGQYLNGTTDITRTLHFGKPSAAEKTDYTLVLKGNLALSMAKFPKGTRGAQLDMLARQPLCSIGKNYRHGTGHGVGHFLNVHEGPQSIRMNENPVTLEYGMITSNEPGIYLTGKYGIRIENLILCKPYKTTDFGEFMQFEIISLAPIDTKALDKKLLTKDEINMLNKYHENVYKKLSPHLNAQEKKWLKKKTQKI
ncbi:MAG: aminopeptidase P family protein [Prevotellaceae bacterium]|jgi:Xaa-Pro aminopeptidase|nr:aminopeptidase P family protein [Prevotellaceae bacterium]